jgi:hypothetical protein
MQKYNHIFYGIFGGGLVAFIIWYLRRTEGLKVKTIDATGRTTGNQARTEVIEATKDVKSGVYILGQWIEQLDIKAGETVGTLYLTDSIYFYCSRIKDNASIKVRIKITDAKIKTAA